MADPLIIPEARFQFDNDDKHGKASRSRCPQWRETLIMLAVIGIFLLFALFILGLIRNGPVLEQTGNATVAMNARMTKMETDIQAGLQNFRAQFPADQEVVTTAQILDSINKTHLLLAWAADMRKEISPELVNMLLTNVNAAIVNVNALFASPNAKRDERARELVGGVSDIVNKVKTLVATITPEEFHTAFSNGNAAVAETTKLLNRVNREDVDKIVKTATSIMASVDSEHLIASVRSTADTVTHLIRLLGQPDGLRVSLPQPQNGKKIEL